MKKQRGLLKEAQKAGDLVRAEQAAEQGEEPPLKEPPSAPPSPPSPHRPPPDTPGSEGAGATTPAPAKVSQVVPVADGGATGEDRLAQLVRQES